MRYTITSAQLSHFQDHGELEFAELYSEEEIQHLSALLEESFLKNTTGRDLERDSSELYKAIRLNRLGQVASALFGEKTIQLAFTQLYPHFLTDTLEESSCVTEIIGGALIDPESGDVIFISPTYSIEFTGFFLLAFAAKNARYKYQENDPHTHLLKKLGYGFGDQLDEKTHPFLIQK